MLAGEVWHGLLLICLLCVGLSLSSNLPVPLDLVFVGHSCCVSRVSFLVECCLHPSHVGCRQGPSISVTVVLVLLLHGVLVLELVRWILLPMFVLLLPFHVWHVWRVLGRVLICPSALFLLSVPCLSI